MPATFTIDPAVATFVATVNGSRQTTRGDLPELTVGAYFRTAAEWDDLRALLTSTFALHSPIGGNVVIIDVLRGAGMGTLVIPDLGSWYAVMIACDRGQYLPNDQSVGSATFLLTDTYEP